MRILFLAILCLVLSGCATVQQQAAAQDTEAVQSAQADCVRRFDSGELKTHVSRAQCLNDAEQTIAGARYPYPDLMNLWQATRIALATKEDAGQLTDADAKAAYAQTMVQIQSEIDRRNAANQMAGAARAQALSTILANSRPAPLTVYQLPQPTTLNCTSSAIGNIINTNCY